MTEEEIRDIGHVEPWAEPVDTQALLIELDNAIQALCCRPQGTFAVAITLWMCFAWFHEIATYSPILVIQSWRHGHRQDHGEQSDRAADAAAYVVAEPRGANVYRLVDRYHPTFIVDEADRLLPRMPDLAHIVNAGWTRGTRIPRVDARGDIHHFDPFCPKLSTASRPYGIPGHGHADALHHG